MNKYQSQKNRRQKIMQKLPDGLIYIKARDEIIRNGDTPMAFRQDSNFLYLTGIEEINYHLVLDPKTGMDYLFIPNIDPLYLIWVGKMYTTAEIKKIYGTQRVAYQSEFKKTVGALARKYKTIYTLSDTAPALKKVTPKHKIDSVKLDNILRYERAFKDQDELRLMKEAAQINDRAFITAMQSVKPGMYEYQIQALIDKVYRDHGAPHNSFATIAAAGRSPAILHYLAYTEKAKKSDFVLIDAGCEVHGYASDITRTFPVDKTFSKKQREIYDIVLHAQKICIKASQPGTPFQNVHVLACRTLLQGLIDVGILKRLSVDDHYAKNVHRLFFPHGIGHLLGIDTHDVGAGVVPQSIAPHPHMRTSVDLLPGMVVTVEPGIYFLDVYFKSAKERRKYQNFVNWSKADQYFSLGGIRIEDNLIITNTGHINLTKIPKEVDEIEALRKTNIELCPAKRDQS